MTVAEIKNLSKSYSGFKLDGVSFSLTSGKIAGFIGRNGAGKTTTIKSMLGLVRPDSGDIKFFGKDFFDNEAEIKQRIGYSSGAINYYGKKRIRDIAAVTKRFYPSWDEVAYKKYLKLFELDENKTPSELSEGMKVKFNLLIALSHKAEILILDEPTSGLDPFSRDELLRVFRLLANGGTSILFSTHIISDIEKCADDIIYIQKGTIFASLPKESFISSYGHSGETLEEMFLRLERSDFDDTSFQ